MCMHVPHVACIRLRRFYRWCCHDEFLGMLCHGDTFYIVKWATWDQGRLAAKVLLLSFGVTMIFDIGSTSMHKHLTSHDLVKLIDHNDPAAKSHQGPVHLEVIAWPCGNVSTEERRAAWGDLRCNELWEWQGSTYRPTPVLQHHGRGHQSSTIQTNVQRAKPDHKPPPPQAC